MTKKRYSSRKVHKKTMGNFFWLEKMHDEVFPTKTLGDKGFVAQSSFSFLVRAFSACELAEHLRNKGFVAQSAVGF